MKVTIDRESCISCGACAGVCAEVFMMDHDGKASITEKYRKEGAGSGEIPRDQESCARSAAEGCAVDVISVE